MTSNTHSTIKLDTPARDVGDARRRAAWLRESAMVFIIGVSLMLYGCLR